MKQVKKMLDSIMSRLRGKLLPEWEYVPEGWEREKNSLSKKGWNSDEILRIYKKKYPEYLRLLSGSQPLGFTHETDLRDNTNICSHNLNMSFAYALARASINKKKLSVLDFGGGTGHYYRLGKALFPELTLDYSCRDLPAFCRWGEMLEPAVRFYPKDSCFKKKYDLVLASSSLHYCKEWQETLEKLISCATHFVFVTRSPFVEKAASFVILQRAYKYGYNTEYLSWCFNKIEFLTTAEKYGTELVREFIAEKPSENLKVPEAFLFKGFLFKK